MSSVKDQAAKMIATAKEHGFNIVVVSPSVVRITKSFIPGERHAFAHCDMMAGSILDLAPLKGGSVWGTDGGSIGGSIALKTGSFVMNKSGTGKRFTSELKKQLGV